jgi:Polyketide cyclase / dehydrase and lipid transport
VITLRSSVCIDAPAADVWDRLARLEDIRLWSEPIVTARCTDGRAHGVGAERSCRLTGGVVIRERWLAWDEGRSFTYEGVGVPLVSGARNRWTVQPEGGRTLLTSEAEVTPRAAGWAARSSRSFLRR